MWLAMFQFQKPVLGRANGGTKKLKKGERQGKGIPRAKSVPACSEHPTIMFRAPKSASTNKHIPSTHKACSEHPKRTFRVPKTMFRAPTKRQDSRKHSGGKHILPREKTHHHVRARFGQSLDNSVHGEGQPDVQLAVQVRVGAHHQRLLRADCLQPFPRNETRRRGEGLGSMTERGWGRMGCCFRNLRRAKGSTITLATTTVSCACVL